VSRDISLTISLFKDVHGTGNFDFAIPLPNSSVCHMTKEASKSKLQGCQIEFYYLTVPKKIPSSVWELSKQSSLVFLRMVLCFLRGKLWRWSRSTAIVCERMSTLKRVLNPHFWRYVSKYKYCTHHYSSPAPFRNTNLTLQQETAYQKPFLLNFFHPSCHFCVDGTWSNL